MSDKKKQHDSQDSDGMNPIGSMSHVIDHAIQIPAPHDIVWAYVSQPGNNPQWQEDCTDVSFLTTHQRGSGTRMRCTGARGKDYVIEITAWYEGPGYEYTIVDGVSYEENRGRIRLQEIAEGTIVQWTFAYELGGMLSGLRNALSTKRQLDHNITESLRNLYRVVREIGRQPDLTQVKSLMRDAPDVDERASYQPRYPTIYEKMGESRLPRSGSRDTFEEEQPAALHSLLQDEPPIAEDDTRPNPAVTPETADEPALSKPEPADETIPEKPEMIDSPPVETAELPRSPFAETQKPDIRDTSQVSVFEVFGLQKPSETGQMKAVTPEDEAEEETKATDEAEQAVTVISDSEKDPALEASAAQKEDAYNPFTDSATTGDTADKNILDDVTETTTSAEDGDDGEEEVVNETTLQAPDTEDTRPESVIIRKATTEKMTIQADSQPGRIGLRLRLRARQVTLRRPS